MSEPVISVTSLQKSFGQNHVLKGIDLQVHEGENVVVLGRSASGKSVLIKIIAGLMFPDSGIVKVLDKEVDKISLRDLRELRMKIGFSFQGSALYDSMTVSENLEFALVRNKRNLAKTEAKKIIEKVLEDVGLLQAIDQLPAELSGGQRKRVGIARTLVLQPQIMLYDEPTSGLDPITSVEINNLINEVRVMYNTTALIITHDLTCAKHTGNRLAMIVDGKFAAQGSFDEVFGSHNKEIKGFYDYNFIKN